VKAKARNVHVVRLLRHFQQLQDANTLPAMDGTDAAGVAGAVDLFNTFLPEAADHSFPFSVQSE
jgi:hypothetical protein